jgi:hypothetical protein
MRHGGGAAASGRDHLQEDPCAQQPEIKKSQFVTIYFNNGLQYSSEYWNCVVAQSRRFLHFSKTHLKKKLLCLFVIGPQLLTQWL